MKKRDMFKENPEKRLLKNYNYAERVKKMIAHEKDDNQKLLLIKYLLYFHSNYVTGKYSDEWIEEQVIQLADRYIEYRPRANVEQRGSLHVMTLAAAIGGHTALVNNWIEFDSNRKYSIVFTDAKREQVPDFLVKTVKKSGGRIYFLHGNNDYRKAKELLRISEHFEKIILSIHMFDIIPVLAYSRKEWKKPIYFYNHADFLFSIGVSIADSYMNLCEYDKEKSKNYRGAHNTQVLRMPQKRIEIGTKILDENKDVVKRSLYEQYNIPKGGRILLSMGADFKYRKTGEYNFIDFAEKLMSYLEPETYFIIIGANPEGERWKKLASTTNGRVKAIGLQNRDEVSRWMKVADAYVSSFPMVSAGAQEANLNKVASFTLMPTRRAGEFGLQTVYENIDDMIIAICEHMKKIESYQHCDWTIGRYEYDPQQWSEELNLLFEQEVIHQCYAFRSKRVYSKEEILNVELVPLYYIFEEQEKLSSINRLKLRMLGRYWDEVLR